MCSTIFLPARVTPVRIIPARAIPGCRHEADSIRPFLLYLPIFPRHPALHCGWHSRRLWSLVTSLAVSTPLCSAISRRLKLLPRQKGAKIFEHIATLPRGADMVLAHMSYSTTIATYPDAQHVIVLREPTTRLLSHFVYWRGLPQDDIAAWGRWGDRLRLSHATLADFLSDDRIACQTDNVALRMLLWPHHAIPSSGFISNADDDDLLAAAKSRLREYAYVDVIERPGFQAALGEWLGRQIDYTSQNVSETMPADLRTDFARLLTPRSISLLRQRTRLDEVLWRAIVGDDLDAEALRLGALLRAVARYSV